MCFFEGTLISPSFSSHSPTKTVLWCNMILFNVTFAGKIVFFTLPEDLKAEKRFLLAPPHIILPKSGQPSMFHLCPHDKIHGEVSRFRNKDDTTCMGKYILNWRILIEIWSLDFLNALFPLRRQFPLKIVGSKYS